MPDTSNECRLLSVSSILGYGFPESSLAGGLKRKPHFIGVDGGSTDPGAFYLGSGECLNSRKAMKRDLRLMLRAGVHGKNSSCYRDVRGAGAEPHLQAVAELAREIAREERLQIPHGADPFRSGAQQGQYVAQRGQDHRAAKCAAADRSDRASDPRESSA